MEPFKYEIIGTSHVSKESVKKIKETISTFNPDFVCVELDRQRLQGLLSNQKSSISLKLITKIGLFGYIFALIAHFIQKKIGKSLNIIPGSDMLSAVKIAKNNKIPVLLIDQDISITLRNISKNFKFKEKMRLVKDILSGVFMPKKAIKKYEKEFKNKKIDLSKVPSDELIEKMILSLKKRYPGLYKSLVSDRNTYMANQVFNILKKNPQKKLLVVVGAGHKKEMDAIIKKKLLKVEYIGSLNEAHT